MPLAWRRRRLPLVAVSALAACRPSPPSAGRPNDLVYVASAAAGTVTPLSAETGQPIEAPIPAGPTPRTVAVAPGGDLLVVSVPLSPGPAPRLTHLTRSVRGWTSRAVALPEPIDQPILSAAGGPYASLLYRRTPVRPGAAPFRIAHLDVERGAVLRVHGACAPGEHATVLAHSSQDTTQAHLGIWAGPESSASPPSAARPSRDHRLITLDLATGATVARYPLPGPASWIHESPTGLRLAAAVPALGAQSDESESHALILTLPTLALLSTFRLTVGLLGVVPTPDGAHAYGLDPTGERLYHLDLTTGTQTLVTALPTPASALAATADSIFVALPRFDQVSLYSRHTHDYQRAIPVDSHPISLQAHPNAPQISWATHSCLPRPCSPSTTR